MTRGDRLNAILKVRLTSAVDKAVLFVLDNFAGGKDDASCWPSIKTIAACACCSYNSAKNSLRSLELAKVITRIPRRRSESESDTNVYLIDYEALAAMASGAQPTLFASGPNPNKQVPPPPRLGGPLPHALGDPPPPRLGGPPPRRGPDPLSDPLIDPNTNPRERALADKNGNEDAIAPPLWNSVEPLYSAYPPHRRGPKGPFIRAVLPVWLALIASGDPNPSVRLLAAVKAYAASWAATADAGKACVGPAKFFDGVWEQNPNDWRQPNGRGSPVAALGMSKLAELNQALYLLGPSEQMRRESDDAYAARSDKMQRLALEIDRLSPKAKAVHA